jgi:hypothetical protein
MFNYRGARWGPQTEGLVQTSDQINMADLNSKNLRRPVALGSAGEGAASEEGSGTVP